MWPQRDHTEPRQVFFRERYGRVCRIRNCTHDGQTVLEDSTIHKGLSYAEEHTRHQKLVRLVNQVAYTFAVADHMRPFRDLLKPDQPFAWTDELDHLFRQSQIVIVDEIRHGVEIFDQSRPTCLSTDWSKEGLGYWLVQKHCNFVGVLPFCCKTGWKIVLMGSHMVPNRVMPPSRAKRWLL